MSTKRIDWDLAVEQIKATFGDDITDDPLEFWDASDDAKLANASEGLFSKIAKAKVGAEKIVGEKGFLLSKSLTTKEKEDRKCDRCGKFTFDINDKVYIDVKGCCRKCYNLHYHGREENNED